MSILEPEYARIKRQGYDAGVRDTKDRIEQKLMQWATTHPDPVVRDELWAAIEHVRKDENDE